MRRNRLKIKKLRFFAIAVSTLYGLLLSASLIILFGFAGLRVDLPDIIISITLFIAVSAGGILSGYTYGKIKRRGGIKGGLICGAVMFAAAAVLGILLTGKIPSLKFMKYLIILCISGAAGGVAGVNTRISRPPV